MFPEVTMFKIPRRDMGAAAVRLLARMLESQATPQQVMLPCRILPGATVDVMLYWQHWARESLSAQRLTQAVKAAAREALPQPAR